jgi:hypothetical protein
MIPIYLREKQNYEEYSMNSTCTLGVSSFFIQEPMKIIPWQNKFI